MGHSKKWMGERIVDKTSPYMMVSQICGGCSRTETMMVGSNELQVADHDTDSRKKSKTTGVICSESRVDKR
jgi:hypothetical protein